MHRPIGCKCLIPDTFVNFRFLLRGENGITVSLLPHKFQEFGWGLAPCLFCCPFLRSGFRWRCSSETPKFNFLLGVIF
jgi:hypothetical protein